MKTTGRLRYSPAISNSGNKVRRDGKTTDWWLIVDCNYYIGHYYRELYRMEHYGARTLQCPVWDSHVSIIRDEIPWPINLWGKYAGQEIEFEYFHTPMTNGTYFWLPAWSEDFCRIRVELGLPRRHAVNFHLTIGNNKHENQSN